MSENQAEPYFFATNVSEKEKNLREEQMFFNMFEQFNNEAEFVYNTMKIFLKEVIANDEFGYLDKTDLEIAKQVFDKH